MNQVKTCYDCASFNKCLERRGICSDFKERVTPRKRNPLLHIWFIRWEDNTIATGGTNYEHAVAIAKSKNMKFQIF